MKEHIRAACELLDKIYTDRTYADRVFDGEDASALSARLVFGVLERDTEISYILDRLVDKQPKRIVRILLKVGVYALLYIDNIPDYAIVNECVETAKAIGTRAIRPGLPLRAFFQARVVRREDDGGIRRGAHPRRPRRARLRSCAHPRQLAVKLRRGGEKALRRARSRVLSERRRRLSCQSHAPCQVAVFGGHSHLSVALFRACRGRSRPRRQVRSARPARRSMPPNSLPLPPLRLATSILTGWNS